MTTPIPLALAAALLALAPGAAGAQAAACNATTSMAAGVLDPVNGDDAFFKRVNPGSNVMLVVDNSGSMGNLPQCNGGWNGTGCDVATISAPTSPGSNAAGTVVVNGTCAPATLATAYTTGTVPAMPDLLWMESITPQRTYADQGRGGADTDAMFDCPPWGNGGGVGAAGGTCATRCTGDGCLFDPDAFYSPSDVKTSYNPISLTRRPSGSPATASDTAEPPVFGTSYTLKSLPGSSPSVPLTLGAVAMKCMAERGFFIYNARFPDGRTGSAAPYTYTYSTSGSVTGTVAVFRGTFLNANPPKAVTARRVIKEILWMDGAAAGAFDTVRFGLAWFASDTAGGLISPLVPTRSVLTATYDRASYRAARQPMIAFINSKTRNFADTATPIGRTLLAVGQYFSQQADSSGNKAYFAYTSSASPSKVSWVSGSTSCGGGCSNAAFIPSSATEGCAVCFPECQKNSVVLVTDGAPNEDQTSANFPADILTNAAIQADYLKYCPKTCSTAGVPGAGTSACCPQYGSTSTSAMVPKVAAWLHRYNLWPTRSPSSAVSLTTYAVGFNVDGPTANTLTAIGALGGGASVNAKDPAALATAVVDFVSKASTSSTSFSAPAVDTLQTSQTSTSDAFLTRFIPNASNTWEGHVFQAALFDEFANGCDATKSVAAQTLVTCGEASSAVNPDLDLAVDPITGKAVCNRVFLVDKACAPIGENTSTGGFYQLDSNGTITNVPAVLPWDAGQVLSDRSYAGKGYRSAAEIDASASSATAFAKPRDIFTWLPVGGVGTRVPFQTAHVATLKPYLSIEPAWCLALLKSIAYSPLPSDQLTECARQIIHWVRGYDIFDKAGTGCRGPGHPLNGTACAIGGVDYGTERDRANDTRTPPLYWKLGDIFHSTPVTVRRPASVLACDLGYESQCLATLHGPASLPAQTPKATYASGTGTVDAWERYRADSASRARVVLVGANDGMLHAFDAGVPTGLPDVLGNYRYTDGTGEELWAFIPPDLLPKLWRLVQDGTMDQHQYMVDGQTMVRDVWVDGSGRGTATLGSRNGVKEATEFHTIAILSERTGGTSYTALDVTDPTSPLVLWTFPRPLSVEARYAGLSWTDFSGRPPPIGPVKLKLGEADQSTRDPGGRGFEERWVVVLNGGYDPTLVRGRAVFMLDVWTGETLWRLTDDDLKVGGRNALGFGPGTSLFPVTGAVALLDVGDTTRSAFDADGFFDTATWGDLGGNLWVARFHAPGEIGASGLVTNWFAARAFEQGRVASDAQSARTRQPFFAMPSNAFEPTTRTLRTFLGSGNRERLTTEGATCSQDDLLGCCQAGCAVRATVSQGYGGTCGWSSTFQCDAGGAMLHAATTDAPAACSESGSCASESSPFTAAASVTISACPAGTSASAAGALACAADGTCSSPSSTPAFTTLGAGAIVPGSATPPPPRFFGIWSYGKAATKMFSSLEGAVAFDGARFTDTATAFAGSCTGTGTSCNLVDTTATSVTYDVASPTAYTVTGNQATADGPGWYYQYQGTNEKTGTGSTVVLGCAAWNGFVATGVTGTTSCSGSAGTLTSRAYLAHYVTGAPTPSCGYADGTGTLARYAEASTSAPPTTPAVRVVVNAAGQVEYSALQIHPGAGPSNKAVGTRTQILEPVYWLEVSRDLHACRHDAARAVSTCE